MIAPDIVLSMPEGHSVHRIAHQFQADFVGQKVFASSPQGRFAQGAELITGREMVASHAVGKHLFLEFDNDLVLRVHLGIYGAWDFAGELSQIGASAASSIGAPRVARAIRVGEEEHDKPGSAAEPDSPADPEFPPDPVGAVRVRLLTDTAVADLRGPTACEVIDKTEVGVVLNRLGPDAANEPGQESEDRVVELIRKRQVPIARLLMDQAIMAGIGNIYRAEMLFRARLDPFVPGAKLRVKTVRALWQDWVELLNIGIDTGRMMTREDLNEEEFARALDDESIRYWVYGRQNEPCRVCGTDIAMELMSARKLYWCPNCQRGRS